jgi:DNA end-binding protein Ku
MTVPWEPEKYRDEYRTAVMELIEQKAKNKKIDIKAPAPHPSTNVVDLVKVLQESLNRSQSVKVKRSGNGSGKRTSTLVKQKRRVAA